MNEFSLIITLFLCVLRGDENLAGSYPSAMQPQISSKYSLGFEIEDSGGSHSTFRKGTVKSTKEKVAMKLENLNSQKCFICQEYLVYKDLQKRAPNLLDKGFPNMYDYGFYNEQRALVMSQLGLDLFDYGEKNNKNYYEWDDLRFIAISAIDELEFLHDAGWVNQDIKPENFMFGIADPNDLSQTENIRVSLNNRLYMIDFGNAIRHQDEKGNCIKQVNASNDTESTPPFYSRTFQKRLTQSRRDDMETLGYVLLDLGGFRLPWEGRRSKIDIMVKQNKLCNALDVVSICTCSHSKDDERIHAALSMYFFILKRLFMAKDGFCEKPDYDAFRKCFDEDPKAHYFNVTGIQFTDIKTVENNWSGKKSGETKAVENQVSDQKPGESKASEEQATDKQPNDPKTMQKKSNGKKSGEPKALEKQTTGKQANEPKTAAKKSNDETKSVKKQANDKKSGESKALEKQTTDKKSSESKASKSRTK